MHVKKKGKSFLSKRNHKAKKESYYVDNERLHQEMVDFLEKCKEAGALDVKPKDWEKKGIIRPDIPKYIGESILNISNRTSMSRSFRNYPFREEFVSDGIENCLKYITNYNPEKYKNPLAYFTQICYYAFIRRIQTEKKSLYVKFKVIQNSEIFGLLHEEDQNHTVVMDDIGYSESARDNMNRFIQDYEDKK